MSLLLSLLLFVAAPADEILLEAEEAELFGVQVATERTGYSGSGYVTGFDVGEDSLRFTFESEGGVFEMLLSVAFTGRTTQALVRIDGIEEQKLVFGTGSSFAERLITDGRIDAGTHTVVISGNFDVDYLRIAPIQEPGPAPPPEQLTDPLATPATRALHRFLLSEYGQHILAGQQNLNEIQYVADVTGREPAIGGFDVIEYSPSRVECGANPGRAVENWIDWAGRDGIVALMWHWNAPTDLIDDDCSASPDEVSATQAWWSGFYTSATTFDFEEVLSDTTSERYQLILRDIDAIAVQLQKFEDADVPILWRPLHEAAGGWFWWGAQSAEAFVQLWRLMYDRLVHHHGIHNLIWVYTHEPNAFDWYPGDEYVDIVSRDAYYDSHEVTMESDWDQLQTYYGERKLVALSESGTLPDPDVITAYGIWWSWFSLWNGRFIRDVDESYLTQVFTSERVMTRDELPDWRALYTGSAPEPTPVPHSIELELYPNPAAGTATLGAVLPQAADVRIDVFDVAGRRVRSYDLGTRSAGALTVPVAVSGAAGVYLVRLIAGDRTDHGILTVIN